MSDKKAKTMDLKGNEYAKVPERLKLFREDCPKGSITTEPMFQPDGTLVFKATIVKDKTDAGSAEATGHALGDTTKEKSFEKLETIAIGRALAVLGYLASGEIASSEEMTEFMEYQHQQREQAINETLENIYASQTLDELKKVFLDSKLFNEKRIVEAKDKRKAELVERINADK